MNDVNNFSKRQNPHFPAKQSPVINDGKNQLVLCVDRMYYILIIYIYIFHFIVWQIYVYLGLYAGENSLSLGMEA